MGKRQIRIFEEEFRQNLPTLLQIEINIILKNDITLHGKIIHQDSSKILFRDSINRTHHLLIDDITEIILDQESNS